jgi:hypothetical protein
MLPIRIGQLTVGLLNNNNNNIANEHTDEIVTEFG